MKVIAGYQQNRRQEYEESADDYGLYLRLHTLNYDVRYVSAERAGWKFSTGVNGMGQMSMNLGEAFTVEQIEERSIVIDADINDVLDSLLNCEDVKM